jgi:hypothetical protein
MNISRQWNIAAVCALAAGALSAPSLVYSQANEQFIPVLVYRSGAYAPNGIPWANGFVDYLNLINERDKGINGVPSLMRSARPAMRRIAASNATNALKVRDRPARRRSIHCRRALHSH